LYGTIRLLLYGISLPLTELVAETERKPSLVDDAYVALKHAIRQGVLPPGYQGSEQDIAAKLNMSRTPVHEAIIRLQSEGLVKVLSKRGVFICTISPDDMREIYDVIIACESMAAELLAGLPEFERGNKANALETLNASMGLALQNDNLLAWAEADDEFHRLLVASCGNGRIARIAESIMDQSHRARMLSLKLRPTPTKSVQEHQLIIDAIRKGLSLEAHNQARAHRAHARDLLLPLLERFGIRHL
jgi:DNA-binding GntR family transcriptional regulator